MVGQHDAPAACDQRLHGILERWAEQLQLIVDGDAQRLEHPFRRVPAAVPGGAGNRSANDVRQLRRRGDRPCSDHRPGDPPSETPLAVVGEQPSEVVFGGVVDDIGSRDALGRIHAHVEWGVEPI